MAYVAVRLLAVLLAIFGASSAWAFAPGMLCTVSGSTGSTIAAACPGANPAGAYTWAGHFEITGGTAPTQSFTCYFDNPNGGSPIVDDTARSGSCVAAACPANSTGTGSCTCNAGFTESGGVCVTACTAGTIKRGYVSAGSNPANVCFGGCQSSVQDVNNQWSVGGVPVLAGTWITTATACSGQPTGNSGTATPSACPPGQGLGTIGGVSSCYPSSPTEPATSTSVKKTTNPDGTSSTTTTTTTNNGGSTSTSTTTTTADASGTPTGTTTTAESKAKDGKENPVKEFCELYPNSPMCKSGSWTGTCAAFTCDGDAVQCAQAQASWAMACEAVKDSAQKTLGQAIVAGSDPDAASLPKPSSPTVVAMGTLASTGWMGRTCPGNQSFTIWGGSTFTLPFASLCVYLEAFGLIIMVVAGVAAARIVGVI